MAGVVKGHGEGGGSERLGNVDDSRGSGFLGCERMHVLQFIKLAQPQCKRNIGAAST